MANRCVMLREGYLEFLTAVSQSELARQFRAATARHVGLHLVALSVGDWQAAQARLASEGFQPNDPVHLARPVRSEEHTSEPQSLMRISYAVFCLKKKKTTMKRRRQT